MNREKYQRASELFNQARQLPPAEWASFLDEACGGCQELRAEVESLLHHHEEAEGFLAESPLRVKLNVQAGPGALDSDVPGPQLVLPSPGSTAEQVSTAFGEFQIIRELGRGGMGVVYEARHIPLDRRVALKVLPQGLLANHKMVERFTREAKVAGRLHHPNIVQVYETGTEAGMPYFSMELVEGETLDQILDKFHSEEPLTGETPERLWRAVSSIPGLLDVASTGGEPCSSASPSSSYEATTPSRPASHNEFDLKKIRLDYFGRVAEAFAGAAEGLHYAHSKGVIHRDIKPSNLILDSAGNLRILDFGLARLEGVERLTLSREFLGTPLYVSPEQARTGKVPADKRTDIYSLGATLYEMLVLRPPFRGNSYHDTLHQVIHTDPPPLRRFNSQIPRDLEAIVIRCLEKEPARRYASAAEMAEDLRRWRRGEAVYARMPTLGHLLWLFVRRHRAAVLSVALVMLVFTCSLTYWILSLREARRDAQEQAAMVKSNLEKVMRLSDIKRLSNCIAEAETLWPAIPEKIPEMEAWLKKAEELKGHLPQHEENLLALREEAIPSDEAINLRFYDTELQWQHDTLAELVSGLKAFSSPDPWKGIISSVRRRLEFARIVHQKTIQEHQAAWDRAIRSIANSDEYPQYKGLEIQPQLGLIPIGPDPDSKLWEFAHLQTGEPPQRGVDGKLILRQETGLVFILIPGGTFQMGAEPPSLGIHFSKENKESLIEEIEKDSLAERLNLQPGDVIISVNGEEINNQEDLAKVFSVLGSGAGVKVEIQRRGEQKILSGNLSPNIDPEARTDERPVHEITVAPFFLSKYEMTQRQWQQFTGENPAYYGPSTVLLDKQHSPLHPVENVSWDLCSNTLKKMDLNLPTEAQWEFACRAGKNTVWWTGNEYKSLEGKVNIADQSAIRTGTTWQDTKDWPELDDGYAAHAPVGTYAANPFGLHEVHGNVWEWCRDWYGSYHLPWKAGDGERIVPASNATKRVIRGGSFFYAAGVSRSAIRVGPSPSYRNFHLGVRPARIISHDLPAEPPLAESPTMSPNPESPGSPGTRDPR